METIAYGYGLVEAHASTRTATSTSAMRWAWGLSPLARRHDRDDRAQTPGRRWPRPARGWRRSRLGKERDSRPRRREPRAARGRGGARFNDLTTDRAGRVFVGSLRRVPSTPVAGSRGLWRIDGERQGVEVYRGIEFANGVGFSPTTARSTIRTTAKPVCWRTTWRRTAPARIAACRPHAEG